MRLTWIILLVGSTSSLAGAAGADVKSELSVHDIEGAPDVFMPDSREMQRMRLGLAPSRDTDTDPNNIADDLMPPLVGHAFHDDIHAYLVAQHDRTRMSHAERTRYDLFQRLVHEGDAVDMERLSFLLEDELVDEYRPDISMHVSSESFESESGSDGAGDMNGMESLDPDGMDSDAIARLREFLQTPDGVEMMASMSDSEFAAFSAMIREISDDGDASDGDRTDIVGDGNSLSLDGWVLDLTEDNDIVMYHNRKPGSGVVLREGMVMGELGRIEAVDIGDSSIEVHFETGQTISHANDELFAGGVPPLDADLSRHVRDEGQDDAGSSDPDTGEIMIARYLDEDERDATVADDTHAPETSLRPQHRENLE